MVAARGLVQHGSGNTTLDEKIAMGYLHVNTGNFPQAIKLFNVLVNLYPKLVAAYLGRGTAYALSGHLSTVRKLAPVSCPACVTGRGVLVGC
jgi:Flp pilus assembly protein TadD